MKKLCVIMLAIILILALGINVLATGYTFQETGRNYVLREYVDLESERFQPYGASIREIECILTNFSKGYAAVYEDVYCIETPFMIFWKGNCVIIDEDDNKVESPENYDFIGNYFYADDDLGWTFQNDRGVDKFGGIGVIKDGKYGYWDIDDSFTISCQYDNPIKRWGEDVYSIGNTDWNKTFINKNGEQLPKNFEFDTSREYPETEVGYYENGYFYIRDSRGFGTRFVDINGETVEYVGESGMYYKGEQKDNITVYEAVYKDYFCASDRESEKVGFVNQKGEIIVPFELDYFGKYDMVPVRDDGSFYAVKDNKWVLCKFNEDAHEEPEKKQFVVTYDFQGATTNLDTTLTVDENTKLVLPDQSQLSKAGYTFYGWYTTVDGVEVKVSNEIVVEKDMNICAKWIKNFTYSGSGSSGKNKKQDKNDVIDKNTKEEKMLTQNVKMGATNEIVLVVGHKQASAWGELVTNDVAPVLKNSRTMLPIRFIAETLGANVEWYEEEEIVKITKENIEIILRIGSDVASVNGEDEKLDSPAYVENNRTYVPLRFVAENLDTNVVWDESNQSIIIRK